MWRIAFDFDKITTEIGLWGNGIKYGEYDAHYFVGATATQDDIRSMCVFVCGGEKHKCMLSIVPKITYMMMW